MLNAIQYLHDVGITHRDLKVLDSSGGSAGCGLGKAWAEMMTFTSGVGQFRLANSSRMGSVLVDGAERMVG